MGNRGVARSILYAASLVLAGTASMGVQCGDSGGDRPPVVDAGACADAECGPAPGAPSHFCDDGSLAGPVCGRDQATGECIWSIRTCPPERQVCGTIAGLGCPDGYFCDLAAGDTCHVTDAAGLCVYMWPNCVDIWEPVCGCDGQTYGNGCDAAANGVSVDHPGECSPTP